MYVLIGSFALYICPLYGRNSDQLRFAGGPMPGVIVYRTTSDAGVTRRAFDAAAAIARATSLPELDAAASKGTEPLGYTTCSLAELNNGRFRFLAGNPPEAYIEHLLASGLMHEDVLFRATVERILPFFWTECTGQRDLTANQRRVIEDRARFGLREGFVSGLHHRDGRVTFVALAGYTVDSADPEVRAASHILADCYGLAARRLTCADPSPPQGVLTVRQIDCLNWVREGKSTFDIGCIMGISAHTVQEHISEACARLGVRTRVQAVAAAMSLHLIQA